MKLSAFLLPAIAAIAGLGAVGSADAQSNSQQILDNLMQQVQPAPGGAPAASPDSTAPRTKVFETVPASEELLQALLPSPQTKDLMVIPRNQQKPVGLMITFDHNSDRISTSAREFLDALAVVLRDPRMQPYRVAMIGHADASGDAGYNLDLSRRRVHSALGYLANQYNIDRAALRVDAVGEYDLVVPSDPFHRHNRSVVIAAVGRR